MSDLGCGREKCAKILAELDCKKGIGLIEKKRQGLGKPDIIYVKNFIPIEVDESENQSKSPADTETSTEIRKSNYKKSENRTSRNSEVEELFELICEGIGGSLGVLALNCIVGGIIGGFVLCYMIIK